MTKSMSDVIEDILGTCKPPDDWSLDTEARIRDYIRQHLTAIKNSAANVVSRTDEGFVSGMGLAGDEGKTFLDQINAELGRVRASDFNAD